jgi:hypothetical protein
MLRTAGSVSTIAIAIVTAWTMSATPAFAQRKIINGLIGAGVAGAIISGAAKAMNQDKPRSGNRSGGSESEGSDRSSKNEKRDTEAEARMAKQFLAQWAELNEVRRAMEMERGRNVEIAIQSFLDKLARNHERLQTGGRSVRATKGEINQVTHGQIKIAIEAAYERANLQEFEKFTGEVWTRDRLLVRILTCAGKQLNPYFLGVGAKGPSMDDLKELFQKVGREVFTTALETSEVIGVSKSFDRFIRTIYENSDNTSDVLWTTGADSKYERVTSGVIESYECLAMTYPELARGGSPTITTNITTTTMVTQRAGIRAPATMPASQQEALWERVRIHIGKTCQGTMPTILASAKSGTIGPVSSRESGLSAQSFIGSVPVGERRQ